MIIPVVRIEKVASKGALCIHGRRIQCETCGHKFNYLVASGVYAEKRADPIFSGDADRLEQLVEGQFKRQLDAIGKNPQVGMAFCPHCGELQPWMKGSGLLATIGLSALTSAIVCGMIVVFINVVAEKHLDWKIWLAGTAIGSLIIGLVMEFSGPRKSKFKIGWAKTDEQIDELKERAGFELDQILKHWLNDTGNKVPRNTVVLGLDDFTGDDVFGEECSYQTLFIGRRKFKKKKKKRQ